MSILSTRTTAVFAAMTAVIILAFATVMTTGLTAFAEEPEASCPDGGYNPTPTAVEITAVPISVASTTDDYFVLHAEHDLDGATVEIPVLVKRGEPGTTTLAENITGLPKERYRVEKYLISDPADVDGDCTDDITELDSLGSMNPVNPATPIANSDGAVAIPDPETLEAVSKVFRGKSYAKFLMFGMDTDRPSIYFINTQTHTQHQHFLDAIGVQQGSQTEMAIGEVIYDPERVAPDGSSGVYYFWSRFYRSFDLTERLHTTLAASMPLLNNSLAYHIPNIALTAYQEDLDLYQASRIDLLFDEDLVPEDSFISLNPGAGYGLLRTLEPDDRPNPRDVVLYEALPNELPRVAGIITTVPQTPLSHVNLRAVQDGIPNAFIRNASNKSAVSSLVDRYVRYEVTDTDWDIRAATKAEVDTHYESSRPAAASVPQRDLSVTEITPLSDIGFDDWDSFGVKAANVAVLGTLGFPEGTTPDGFAIPFYFYDEFMKHNDFYTRIETMLADMDFQTDLEEQSKQLKALRKDIEDADTPDWIITALADMNTKFPQGTTNRKYRSSTNNEDLPRFSGAGLYDSKSQKPDEDEDDGLDKSLKEVYASLWNFRAFTERDFHRIDHLKTAMGILVHPSYQDELVNGVAVSFDPISDKEDTYYVNSQVGEDLVTNPEAHSVPEEILLTETGLKTILHTSNLTEPGKLLMTDVQLEQLREHLSEIHDHFETLYNPGTDESFAMEIEFKITSANILAIKQARPWVFSGAGMEPVQYPPLLSVRHAEATEGSNIEFTMSMSQTATDTVTVQYSTSDGTATSSDYTPASAQTITFAAGETEKTVSIATTDDSDEEEDESFQLVLSSPSTNAELASISTATGTIRDNDEQILSDDATLSALALADLSSVPVALTPQFISETTAYTASAANSVGYITITPAKSHNGAQVTVTANGASTPDTGTADLTVGDNLITVTVTAEDRTSQQSYTITVTRGPSDDATLSTLSLAGDAAIILTPAFDPATTGYTAEVANTVESISLTAQANHDGASVSTVDADGASIPDTARIDLQYGENIITVVVSAQDGATTLRYQVTITRAFAWHTTMTVGERLTAIPQASGYTTWGEDMGSLSTERMELNGTRYRVLSLMRYAGGLYLNINQALPGDFTLTVGNQDFLASESADPPTPAAGRYWWEASAISWIAGDQVEVSIVPVPGSESLPARPLAPPIAQFKRVPESHDGSTKFTFKLDFTADVRISYRTLKDHAFQVTNGTVKKAKRTVEGSDMNWTITVKPNSQNDIEIRLPATQDCAAQSAICTRESRMLFNTTAFTVSGPSTP